MTSLAWTNTVVDLPFWSQKKQVPPSEFDTGFGFFARTCKTKHTLVWSFLLRDRKKSQHQHIVSNSGWKLSPMIHKGGGGGGGRGGKRMSWVKKIEKFISGETSIRHSAVGKFRLKMALLNFWIKLTQKGYFQTKKMKITIEFYIFKLI